MGKTRGVVPTAGAVGLSEGEAAAYRPGGAIRPGGGVLASTRLKRAGGSLVIVVPAAARNLLGLAAGTTLVTKTAEVIALITKQVTVAWYINTIGTTAEIIFVFIPFDPSACTNT